MTSLTTTLRQLTHDAYWLSPYRLNGYPIETPHPEWEGDESYWVKLDPHIRVGIYSWHELYEDGKFVGRDDPDSFNRRVREFATRRGQWAQPELVEAQASFPDLFGDADDHDIYALRDVEWDEMTPDEQRREMAR